MFCWSLSWTYSAYLTISGEKHMYISYLRQTTYFWVLPSLQFCGQREWEREREKANYDLEVSIWKTTLLNDWTFLPKISLSHTEHFLVLWNWNLWRPHFLSTGCSVTPNRLASFHSDVTNPDLAPDTALTLFLFPPPPHILSRNFTVRIPWALRHTADKVVT